MNADHVVSLVPKMACSSDPTPGAMATSQVHGISSPKPVPDEKDPVCGMTVDSATTPHHAEFEDKTYHFCSSGCRTKFIVLPAEYAIDPTGVGRMLKLTQMGEIKTQLAAEAEADRLKTPPVAPAPAAVAPDQRSSLMGTLLAGFFIAPAQASERIDLAQAEKTDETVITLDPTKGAEYKLTMVKGAKVTFDWSVKDGVVNYIMHGTPGPGAKETTYKEGRAVAGDQGVLTADYDGGHGWFWRNRGTKPVTIILRTKGAYAEIKRMS